MATYYDRAETLNTDGTPLFCADYDKQNEREVVGLIEKAWRCEVQAFGRLCPVDYYATRDGRMVGVMEIKTRTHASDTHATVYLNLRKWLALMMVRVSVGCPAVFIARFTDCAMWVDVCRVDASVIKIGGCRHVVKSHADVEPMILIPVSSMSRIEL